ncbi:Ig-like domain-containing protein [Ignavibacterium sp.]|uniref:Ig-like domain-containing protein n=1 Tax=Ignavibacterium sp. TaxID=2651167 RepID=UPI00307EC892
MKLFLIILILTIRSFAQHHYIRIVFSEKMDLSTILEINNYTVYNTSMQKQSIDNVGIENDSTVILIITPLVYKSNYLIKVENVKDLGGNYINNKNTAWIRFDGFDTTQAKPKIKIKRR